MSKNTIRNIQLVLGLALVIVLFLVYFSENRIALIINQSASIPSEIEDITILKRRGLANILVSSDATAIATCRTKKIKFKEYLKSLEFEMIHIPSDTSKQKIFYSAYTELPQEIVNSTSAYTIQLARHSTNVRILNVAPDIDTQYVLLKYYMDWN